MRPIDADALIEYFSLWLDDEHYVERTFKEVAEEDIIPIIDKAPTIEAEPTEEQIQKYILDHNLTHKIFEPVPTAERRWKQKREGKK